MENDWLRKNKEGRGGEKYCPTQENNKEKAEEERGEIKPQLKKKKRRRRRMITVI